MPQPTPLNDSLNGAKERWGMPTGAVMALLAAAGLVGYWISSLLGVCIAIGVPIVSKALVSFDPKIYRLAALSLRQYACYDPGRRRES